MKTFKITLAASNRAAAVVALQHLAEDEGSGLDDVDSLALAVGGNAFDVKIERSGDYADVPNLDGTELASQDGDDHVPFPGISDAALLGGLGATPPFDGEVAFKVVNPDDPSTFEGDSVAELIMSIFAPRTGGARPNDAAQR